MKDYKTSDEESYNKSLHGFLGSLRVDLSSVFDSNELTSKKYHRRNYKKKEVSITATPDENKIRSLTDFEIGNDEVLPENTGKYRYIGNSLAARKVLKMLEIVRETLANVIIIGETGTGKEEIAQIVYNESSRKDKPLVVINAGKVPENSEHAQSEIFGHEKGAFTGADKKRIGKLQYADGGTAIIDDAQDLHKDVQAKLLRASENGEIEPLGSDAKGMKKVDIRYITTVNENIYYLVKTGKFKRDLVPRLAQITIYLPSLKEMGDDVILIAENLIQRKDILQHCFQNVNIKFKFEDNCHHSLKEVTFRENVRQLKNALIFSMARAKESKVIKEGYLLISKKHLIGGIVNSGAELPKSLQNKETKTDDLRTTQTFLDVIEKIILEKYPYLSNQKISMEKVAKYFTSSQKEKVGISKQAFEKYELSPRKSEIKILFKRFPEKWSVARAQCSFLIKLDVNQK
ncbi:MAG: sigma-54-dependent Fis family transcriptional regulator [Bacteroidetes bacterium]|nr:sigma-54-dependent Fis family transcriptional regulator [Bacteroidota bacterium]